MDRGKESEQRVTKEREFEEDCYIHLVLLTAGAAVLMACLKRFSVVFLVEEWRAWVFLFLNLVLLAILFTSTLSKSKESQDCQREENHADVKIERNRKVKKQRSKCWSEQVLEVADSHEECQKKKNIGGKCLSSATNGRDEKIVFREEDLEPPRLSNEEINERAEAFILMFRRHLVSDARKFGKEYLLERKEQLERVKFQTCPKMT